MCNDKPMNKFNDIIQDKLYIGNHPNDLKTEIQENTWFISLSEEERSKISVADIKAFYQRLIINRSEQIRKAAKHGMIFYTWFDEQASQLRFSLISDFHTRLPFEAKIIACPLDEIIKDFFAALSHIPFSELEFVSTPLPEKPDSLYRLKVFQVHLSRLNIGQLTR